MQMYLSFFGIALQFIFIWTLYTNDGGNYRVLVPQIMQTQSKVLATTTGDVVTYTSYTEWSPKDGHNGVFMIHHYDLSKDQIVSKDPELIVGILDGIVNGLETEFQGELLYENSLDDNAVYGRLLRIEYNNGHSSMKAKIFIDFRRVYILQVLTDKNWAFHESVDKFLDSFEILE